MLVRDAADTRPPAFTTELGDESGAAGSVSVILDGRAKIADTQRLDLTGHDDAGRVARRLVERCDEHGAAVGTSVEITLPITQEELAGWTATLVHHVRSPGPPRRPVGVPVGGRQRSSRRAGPSAASVPAACAVEAIDDAARGAVATLPAGDGGIDLPIIVAIAAVAVAALLAAYLTRCGARAPARVG